MKYKALQVAPEYQDSGWDWFTDDDGRLWDVVDDDKERYCLTKYATLHFKYAFNIINDYDRSYYESHMNEWLNDIIKPFYDIDGKNVCTLCGLTQPKWEDARQRAKRAIRDYCHDCDIRRGDMIEAVADILSAVTGINFIVREIRGCCQGDYAQLIIPKEEATDDCVEEIEARYFNEGKEWSIESEDDTDFFSNAFTYGYKDEDILKQIREQCDIADDDEIELWEFDDWEKTPKYKLAN